MTTLDLSTELYTKIEIMRDDESAMRKLLAYANELLSKRHSEESIISKQQAITDIKDGLTEFKSAQQGQSKLATWDEFKEELQRDGYYD